MRERMLLHRIRKGNSDALDNLIKTLYPSVYSFVYRKMQGDDVAKDITQETFLRFLRYLPNYHEEGKLLHFLYRIAANACMDEFRRQNKSIHMENDDGIEQIADECDVHEAFLRQCTQEELLYFIGQLTPAKQDVILLHYFHELTFREIAELFDQPLSSVKTRHRAALRALYLMMKKGDSHAQ